MWREIVSTLRFLFSYGLFSGSSGSSYRFVDRTALKESEKVQEKGTGHHALPNISEDDDAGHEEDLEPGGDYIKLLLLPKPFSPSFRENWDIYRTEYWEKENERRANLLKIMKARDRKFAKEQGGWLWWTGYRGWNKGKTSDPEKVHHQHHSVHRHGSVLDKEQKRTRSSSVRAGSHSRNSSRSTTPQLEADDGHSSTGRVRRGSNASSASERRRKKTVSAGAKLTPSGSRSATPEVRSPLVRESSFTSISSVELDRPGSAGGDKSDSAKSSLSRATGVKSGVSRKGSGRGRGK